MSTTMIQPYLYFDGCCEQALEFYTQAIGAKVEMMMRFNESPVPPPPGSLPPGFEDKVMHASFRVGESLVLASDGCGDEAGFGGFSLSIVVQSKDDGTRLFNALAEDGNITMPLGETFWSPQFGMVTDRFGVRWLVNCVEPPVA